MFVAPITGLYSFQLTVMNNPGSKRAWAELKLENRILQIANGHGAAYNIGIASAVVKVNKGEHVYAYLKEGVVWSDGGHWTNFVGHLVTAM